MASFTTHAEPATEIQSSKFHEHVRHIASLVSRVHTGFTITLGTFPNYTIEDGIAFLEGKQVGDLTDGDQAESIQDTSDGTKFIWLQKNGNTAETTTATAPSSGALLIAEIDVSSSSFDTKRDERVTALKTSAKLEGEGVESVGSDAFVKGHRTELVDAQPESTWEDTTVGDEAKAGIRLRQGKLEAFTEDLGSGTRTTQTDDLLDIATPVDETDTDTTKDKTVSNALAKGWEDHKDATAPHGGHSLVSDEGAADGIAELNADAVVPQSQLDPTERLRTSFPASPSSGDVGIDGKNLKYHDGQGTPATQTVEVQSNKGEASGYGSLGSDGLQPAGELAAASESRKGGVQLANAAAETVGDSNAKGSSNRAARMDHAHAHGDQSTTADVTHHAFAQVSGSITDSQHGNRGGGSLHSLATQSSAGFMSNSDKTKLDESTRDATAGALMERDASGRAKVAAPSASDDIARKSEVDTVQSDLDSHKGSGGGAHSNATTNLAGFMSASDKSKLNDIEPGADVNDVTSVFGRTGAVTAQAGDYSQHYIDEGQSAGGDLGGTYPNPSVDTLLKTLWHQMEAGSANEYIFQPSVDGPYGIQPGSSPTVDIQDTVRISNTDDAAGFGNGDVVESIFALHIEGNFDVSDELIDYDSFNIRADNTDGTNLMLQYDDESGAQQTTTIMPTFEGDAVFRVKVTVGGVNANSSTLRNLDIEVWVNGTKELTVTDARTEGGQGVTPSTIPLDQNNTPAIVVALGPPIIKMSR